MGTLFYLWGQWALLCVWGSRWGPWSIRWVLVGALVCPWGSVVGLSVCVVPVGAMICLCGAGWYSSGWGLVWGLGMSVGTGWGPWSVCGFPVGALVCLCGPVGCPFLYVWFRWGPWSVFGSRWGLVCLWVLVGALVCPWGPGVYWSVCGVPVGVLVSPWGPDGG